MEEALRQYRRLIHGSLCNLVSILVLMEEALRPYTNGVPFLKIWSFNPCFNGRGVRLFIEMNIPNKNDSD